MWVANSVISGNGVRSECFCAALFLRCDVLLVSVFVLMLTTCQSFSTLYKFPARRASLPVSKCCYRVPNIKQTRKTVQIITHPHTRKTAQSITHIHTHTHTHTHTRTHTCTNEKKKSTKTQVRRIPCAVTISTPCSTRPIASIGVVTATRLILSSLRLESPQLISSFKLLCCHHSNHYVSRTRDL